MKRRQMIFEWPMPAFSCQFGWSDACHEIHEKSFANLFETRAFRLDS